MSLTTIRERLGTLHLCIESLLRQSCRPDQLLLWVDERVAGSLPQTLVRLQPRGLTIRRCRDIGPYTKIIFALRDHPDAIVVTADDDCFYPRTWLEELYAASRREPQMIHCHRAHWITLDERREPRPYREWMFESPGVQGPSARLFPTGCSGVLYPPGSLAAEVSNERVFTRICATSDDIWLKAMALLAGTPCRKVRPFQETFVQIEGSQRKALWQENVVAGRNDEQLRAVCERYQLAALLAR